MTFGALHEEVICKYAGVKNDATTVRGCPVGTVEVTRQIEYRGGMCKLRTVVGGGDFAWCTVSNHDGILQKQYSINHGIK